MPRDRIEGAHCVECGQNAVACTYNRFEDAQKRIDSWEHRCGNCGFRVTQAFRSDDPKPLPADPQTCPFCGRRPSGT